MRILALVVLAAAACAAVVMWVIPRPAAGSREEEGVGTVAESGRCLRLGPMGYFDGEWWGEAEDMRVLVRLDQGEGVAAIARVPADATIFDVVATVPMISIGGGEEVPDADSPEFVFYGRGTGRKEAVWHIQVPEDDTGTDGEHIIVCSVVGDVAAQVPLRLYRVEGATWRPKTAGKNAEEFERLRVLAR